MRVNFKSFKYQTTDEATPASVVFSGSVINAQAEGGSVEVEPHLIEEIYADNPEPAAIYQVGNKISGKAVLIGSSLDDLAAQLNGTNSSGITIKAKPDSIAALSKRAVTFATNIAGGSTVETYIITNVVFTGKLSAAFKGDAGWYLPIEFRSLRTSQMTIAQA